MKKFHSLSRRVTRVQSILMWMMGIILGIVIYISFSRAYLKFYNEKAQDIVRIVANHTDWEQLEPYAKTGEPNAYFEEMSTFYNDVKENFTGVGYLYLFVPGMDSFTYLYEARRPDDDPALISQWGEVFDYTESEYEHLVPDILAEKPSTTVHVMGPKDARGLEVWAPVFDQEGVMQAMVEADYELPSLNQMIFYLVLPLFIIVFICVTLAWFFMLWFMQKNVGVPIARLNQNVDAYEHGELEQDFSLFPNNDEIKNLASSFQGMTQRLMAYTEEVARITGEKERIGAELNVANQIQAHMLPSIFPPFPDRKEFDIYATMTPAKEVGGDFYDFFLLDDDHLALVIADVSGKGIPAALFMTITKILIKNRALLGGTPKQILFDVNNQLCEGNEIGFFVTCWMAVVDLRTGKGLAVNAGHEHPAVGRGDGSFELIKYRHSLALGIMEDMPFPEHPFELHPGDRLFVYTDGVTEATNGNSELFGEERMVAALNKVPGAEPEAVLRAVKEDIDVFVGDAFQFDDITMLEFAFKGTVGKDNTPE